MKNGIFGLTLFDVLVSLSACRRTIMHHFVRCIWGKDRN